ncbi:MAG: glycosyltransferase family 39 protein [Planctomycetota bacterium]
MDFFVRCRFLFRTYRFELALFALCAAVFVPAVISEHEQRRPRGILFGDIPFYIGTVQSLVEDGDLDLRNQMNNDLTRIQDSIGVGVNGEWYSTHPVLMPIVSIPFYIFFGMNGFLVFNLFVCMGMVQLIYRLCRLFAPEWAAFVTALVFAFATQIMVTLYNFSPDAFSTLLTLTGIYHVLRERPLAGGVFWGLAILSRITNVVPYAAVFLYLWTGRRRGIATLKFLAGSVPFLLVFLGMNWAQYGDPLALSYSRVLANTENGPMITRIAGHFGLQYAAGGLWGQLADRDHGLFFNNAVSLVGVLGLPLLFRKNARSAVFIALVALSIYVLHGFFKLWYISHPGSNRYLFTTIALMAVPFACLLGGVFRRGKSAAQTGSVP